MNSLHQVKLRLAQPYFTDPLYHIFHASSLLLMFCYTDLFKKNFPNQSTILHSSSLWCPWQSHTKETLSKFVIYSSIRVSKALPYSFVVIFQWIIWSHLWKNEVSPIGDSALCINEDVLKYLWVLMSSYSTFSHCRAKW